MPLTTPNPNAPAKRALASVVAMAAALTLSTGCATMKTSKAPEQADYVLTYLKTGPKSGSHTKEESSKIFGGHMANMKRLGEAGDLVIHIA